MMRKPALKRMAAAALILMMGLALAGCRGVRITYNRQSDSAQRREKYGSFSPDLTTSYDGRFYAVQQKVRPEGMSVDYIHVTVYDAEAEEVADSFLTERAWDFWGICWEQDSYDIWVQSGDIGTYCMKYEEGRWVRSEDHEEPLPPGIIPGT